jgi:ribosomal protein S18 acetylase RimI-like enzyme
LLYRVATPADAAALSAFGGRLFVDSYEHLMERGELEDYVRENFTAERQLAELNNPAITTFLAIDGEIAGYAQFAGGNVPECPLPAHARAPAELKRIYVDRRWQGHGVARELVRLVEGEALKHACDVLWLAVWEINDRAIAFYHKCDFRIIGRQGFPIGNEVQTDHVMAKTFGQ